MPAATEKIIRVLLPDHTELICHWVRGGVKNINLRMYADGTLRVSSPRQMTEDRLRTMLTTKMDFITASRIFTFSKVSVNTVL